MAFWLYWIITLVFCTAMAFIGVLDLRLHAEVTAAIGKLSLPNNILSILGVAYILGSLTIIFGRPRMLKEWAYAGFSFSFIGAAAFHYMAGEVDKMLLPLVLLAAALISYFLWKRLVWERSDL